MCKIVWYEVMVFIAVLQCWLCSAKHKKEEKKKYPCPHGSHWECNQSFPRGQDFIPATFILLSSCSCYSDWVTGEDQVRCVRAAGNVFLNKLSSVGILESRSLSDTNSKHSLPAGFHCQPQGLFQKLYSFSVGVVSCPCSAGSFYMLLTFRRQLVWFNWITPALPVENL